MARFNTKGQGAKGIHCCMLCYTACPFHTQREAHGQGQVCPLAGRLLEKGCGGWALGVAQGWLLKVRSRNSLVSLTLRSWPVGTFRKGHLVRVWVRGEDVGLGLRGRVQICNAYPKMWKRRTHGLPTQQWAKRHPNQIAHSISSPTFSYLSISS